MPAACGRAISHTRTPGDAGDWLSLFLDGVRGRGDGNRGRSVIPRRPDGQHGVMVGHGRDMDVSTIVIGGVGIGIRGIVDAHG